MRLKLNHICILSIFILFCAADLLPAAQNTVFAPSCDVTDRYHIPLRNILSGKDNYFQPVDIDNVSPYFVLAVLAAEDKRFFEHGGVDLKAIARAMWQNISGGKIVSGASTITQQLVSASNPKNKNIISKIRQAAGAFKLEKEMSKRQILQAYFNTVNLGGNIYGVETAARIYFNSRACALSLSQAAFLAGIIKSPARYNPRKNFPAALKRRDAVLGLMYENGFINDELYKTALGEKIELTSNPPAFTAPHYSEFIAAKVPDCKGEIQTTIDGNIQSFIEGLLPSYLEKLKTHRVTNAAVVVLDNASGDILAFAGSADYFNADAQGFVNGAVALRQPGSALKPFVYAAAFENGYLPSDKINDEDTFFKGGFRPRNYDEGFHGSVSLRHALACSYNIPAAALTDALSAGKVLDTLRKCGFISLTKTAQEYGLGISLGNGEVTLLELANAYRVLANGGEWSPLRYALNPLISQEGKARRVFSEESAFMVTNILSDNNARSPAFGFNSPLNLPFAFAAKTGTSKDYRDNIAAGYNRRFTAAVWVGNFNGESMRKVSGITGAAPLLGDIFMFLQARYPQEAAENKRNSFDKPSGIVRAEICQLSGLLAGANCPYRTEEVFPQGKAPQKICALSKEEHIGQKPQSSTPTKQGILFPSDGDVFIWDPSVTSLGQQLLFKANLRGKWMLNGQEYKCPQECFWPLKEGEFTLELLTPSKTYSVKFTVLK